MKYKSALLHDLSGKIGGAVASKARGDIGYFRKLVTPSNPNTAMQKASRDAITSAAVYWRETLTEEQQELWWDEAEGSQTGQSLFTRCNQPRIFANNAGRNVSTEGGDIPLLVITAPPLSKSTPFSGFNAVVDDSANTLTVTMASLLDPWIADAIESEPGVAYVYASHQQNSSRFARQHPYQMVASFVCGAPTITALVTNLAPLGFTSSVGKVMYVKVRVQDKAGGISGDIIKRIVVTA